jgi:hypothetical protein
MEGKIGVGIITCNRENFFNKCYNSIPDYIDELIIVNDGNDLSINISDGLLVQGNPGKQVGKCKNIAMSHLLNKDCDYIFTLEDDIFLEDPNTFKKYIEAHKETGIHHFNFGFSQKENLDHNFNPVYKKIVEYKNCKLVLTPNVLGAFTFYTKECLQTIGLHHKDFNKGHGDHPELTYRAYKHGFTTPFWWFADIYGSWDLIKNQSNMGDDSLVRNQTKFFENFKDACNTFKMLHGVDMLQVPLMSEAQVIDVLKKIKSK